MLLVISVIIFKIPYQECIIQKKTVNLSNENLISTVKNLLSWCINPSYTNPAKHFAIGLFFENPTNC